MSNGGSSSSPISTYFDRPNNPKQVTRYIINKTLKEAAKQIGQGGELSPEQTELFENGVRLYMLCFLSASETTTFIARECEVPAEKASELFAALKAAALLEHLDVSGSTIPDLSVIAELKSLRTLSANTVQFSSLARLAPLSLDVVHFENNDLDVNTLPSTIGRIVLTRSRFSPAQQQALEDHPTLVTWVD